METGQYMQWTTDNGYDYVALSAKLKTDEAANTKNALWVKTANSDGTYTLKNVGKNAYLKYSVSSKAYYKTCFDASATNATHFYIYANPFSNKGYAVSTQDPSIVANAGKYSWYAYYDSGLYWLCSTESAPLNNTSNKADWLGASTYYHLSTFRFLTYSDLLRQAGALGITGMPATPTTVTDYATLVNAIVDKLTTYRDEPFATDAIGLTTHVVIRNQRYGTYLAMSTDGSYYASNAITSDCIWTTQEIDKSKGQYNFVCFGARKNLTVNGNNVVTLYHSNEPDTVMMATGDNALHLSGFFRIAATDAEGKTTEYVLAKPDGSVDATATAYLPKSNSNNDDHFLNDPDWSIEAYDLSENIENTAVREASIDSHLFFRIQNEGYSLGLGANHAGWLNDADHVDMRGADYYLSDKTPDKDNNGNRELIYAFTVRPKVLDGHHSKGKASANSLWHLIRIAKAGDDMPIGIIGKHDHDIYLIQNANTGEYLSLPASSSKFQFITQTSDRAKADKFWLEDIGKGQYAIAARDPAVTNSDSRKGYLTIRNKDDNDIYRAALILDATSYTKSTPTAGTTAAWSILQATTVAATTATADQTDDKAIAEELGFKGCGFRYVTAFYPFDITPITNGVRMFKAVSGGDGESVTFREVKSTVPANNGVLCFVPYDTGDQGYNIEFAISNATATDGEYADNILTGMVQSEKGYVFCDIAEADEQEKKRQEIYIFSTLAQGDGGENETVALGLYHPLDKWLMANRCFIPASKLGNATAGAKHLGMKLEVDNGGATAIHSLATQGPHDDAWYDLTGRRVMHPTKGLYIHNGHKIVIQ